MELSDLGLDDQLPAIPDSLQFLIADYGKYVGLDGFAFDEENMIFMEVNGRELLIQYGGEQAGLLFQSKMKEINANLGEEVLSALLQLNANGFRTGVGMLAVNAEPHTSTLIWMDRVALSGMTVESLDAAIDATSLKMKLWDELIGEFLEPMTQESAGADASAVELTHNAIPV